MYSDRARRDESAFLIILLGDWQNLKPGVFKGRNLAIIVYFDQNFQHRKPQFDNFTLTQYNKIYRRAFLVEFNLNISRKIQIIIWNKEYHHQGFSGRVLRMLVKNKRQSFYKPFKLTTAHNCADDRTCYEILD